MSTPDVQAPMSDEEFAALNATRDKLSERYRKSRLFKITRRWSNAFGRVDVLRLRLENAEKAADDLHSAMEAEKKRSPEDAEVQKNLYALTQRLSEERKTRIKPSTEAQI